MIKMSGTKQKDIASLQNYDRVVADFKRRALRKEFPTTKFIVYLHFSFLVIQEEEIVQSLTRYGCDVLFPKLHWMGRIALMDVCQKLQYEFKDKFFLKVAIEILRDPYQALVTELALESLIQMIGFIHQWSLTMKTTWFSKIELWGKL